MADPGGAPARPFPPTDQNFLNFIHFFWEILANLYFGARWNPRSAPDNSLRNSCFHLNQDMDVDTLPFIIWTFKITLLQCRKNFEHLCMWVGNVFSHVCVCVCLSVWLTMCLSVCVSVNSGYNFWKPSHRIFIFWHADFSIKIIGLRSRSYEKK